MAVGYLLRAQELLGLVDNDPAAPIKVWLQGHVADAVSVSVIGVALARAEIETIDDPNERIEAHGRLARVVSMVRNRAGVPLAFDSEVAEIWQRLLSAPQVKAAAVPHVSLQEYAVAIAYGLTVAESARPWHGALQGLGVSFEILH